MATHIRPILSLTLIAFVLLGLPGRVHAQVRHSNAGDPIERFTLPDIDGRTISSDALRGRTWFLIFVSAHQKRSERALDDLSGLITARRAAGQPVELVIVISGGAPAEEFFRGKQEGLPPGSKMLVDPDDSLWGHLGVIVTPTTILIDAEGTVRWFRAGHTFDYTTAARANIDLALGLVEIPVPDAVAPEPTTTAGDSVSERAWRHLRMAQVLGRRGEVAEALVEVRRARDLTPGDFAVEAELAELLCRAGQAKAALEIAAELQPSTPSERARSLMLAGWAHRQHGDLDRAEALLNDAVTLDPGTGRAFYELGKVFEQRGDSARALEMYRRALEVQFGEAKAPPPPPSP